MSENLCPCGSRQAYQTCCYRFISGQVYAETPEQLMRSRYSAFSKGDIDYLIASHHPSKRQPNHRTSLANTIEQTTWLGLKIVSSAPPQPNDTTGYVEFAAFYQQAGQSTVEQLHEKSEFTKQSGQWYYLQGQLLDPIQLGRNDLCWCGSGKKYKRCHGK